MDWGLAVNITFLVFLLLILAILIIMLVFAFSTSPPRALDYMLEIPKAPTNRNSEVIVDVKIKYRYSSLKQDKFPNSTDIKTNINDALHISAAVADGIPWEDIAKNITMQVYDNYNVLGVSTQLELTSGRYVIYTEGYITSIDQF